MATGRSSPTACSSRSPRTHTTRGAGWNYPANETSLLYSIARAAKIWNDLDRLGVPGIRGVYCHPAARRP